MVSGVANKYLDCSTKRLIVVGNPGAVIWSDLNEWISAVSGGRLCGDRSIWLNAELLANSNTDWAFVCSDR